MTTDQRQGWIRYLAPGDVVGVDRGAGAAPHTVQRVTPSGQIVVSGYSPGVRFDQRGWSTGVGPFRSWLVQWTPQRALAHRAREAIDNAARDAQHLSHDVRHLRGRNLDEPAVAELERIRDDLAAAVEVLDGLLDDD